MTEPPKVTAGELANLVRRKFEKSQGWWVLEEIPNGTGYRANRFCDVIAIQTFPSRGLSAHGFEIKVDRGDVIRELREPKKADAFQRWCDYWWLVVPSEDLIDGLVLPEAWGVMVVAKGRLKETRKAPKLEAQPWERSFVAALARGLTQGMVPVHEHEALKADLQPEIERQVDLRIKNATRDAEEDTRRVKRSLEDLRASILTFEAQSGIRIGVSWDAKNIGAAAKLALRLIENGEALRPAIARVNDLHGSLADLQAAIAAIVNEPAPSAPDTCPACGSRSPAQASCAECGGGYVGPHLPPAIPESL